MSDLLPGTEVRARGLRWELVLTQALGPQTLHRLRGLDGAVQGQEIDLLSPFESIEPIVHDLHPEKAAPLRNWLVYHQAFLLEQALGPDALLTAHPGRLRVEPYQLVPVVRALRTSRVRLLLADGVGLGKTIEAGLILTELLARRIAHRILIVSPAGPLLDQWRTEMTERFGLRPDVLDRSRLEEIRRSTELGANPFDHVALGLVSIDFLKQERILDQLERTSYDVVVIDEAHHCMDLGAAADREDSQRRRLAQVLSRRSDALLLLTATPHDGNDASFASLCELLDPSLVDGRGALRGEQYRAHVVRRLKRHIKDPQTGEDRFKERIVYPCPVIADDGKHLQFIKLQRALLDLIAPELRRAFRARQYSDVLSFIALLKRSVSTVAACESTLRVVADRFQTLLTGGAEDQETRRQRLRTLREYHRRLERFGTAAAEEEQERELLEAEDLACQLAAVEREVRAGSRALSRVASVVEALDELVALAESAREEDPKLEQLAREIATIRREEPEASILVYTEYTTSQDAAADSLRRAGVGDILTMRGEDAEADRKHTTNHFRTEDGLILLSTDAAAEGLNLHQRCHHLIHLELPFNPNRLEQRNGRIDRYGQTRNPIVRYLFLRGTFEDRILLRLIAKYERQRARLTFVPNTLGLTVSGDAGGERLLKGLMDEDAHLFRQQGTLFDFAAAEENGADEATRELLEEIDRSLKGFEKTARTHTWLGEAGLNAEARLAGEADQARERGEKVSQVEVTRFVAEAALLDGGQVLGSVGDDLFEILLPPTWLHGLEDLPGYDPAARRIRLTTRLELLADATGRSVGFLGRAHPLVRRALDRVRHLSFGGSATWGQDPRASAVTADVPEPTLLYTFLGRVLSEAGRELERMVAVRISPHGEPTIHDEADQWVSLADPARALRTTDLWTRHFAGWATDVAGQAQAAAESRFRVIAQVFMEERRQALDHEPVDLQAWIEQRARQITGDARPPEAQISLFTMPSASAGEKTSRGEGWSSIADPAERLAAFAADPGQTAAKRSEAEGVLRIHRQRLTDLKARLTFRPPEMHPLGVLMLVPRGLGT